MAKPTAVVYARVSSRRQADEDVSLPSQLERGRERVAQMGANLLGEFSDAGHSGWVGARDGFEAAIQCCERHSVDYLITWSSSRFIRNREEAVLAKRRLSRAGTTLIYLSIEVDTNTDGGFILDAMLEIVDEMRSREISKDTKRSMISNARKGFFCGGSTPFGYQVVPAPGNERRRVLTPDKTESRTVRRMFQLRASGAGALGVAARLNHQGMLRRGKRWNKSSVLSVCASRAALGQTVFNRKDRKTGRIRPESEWIVTDSHPPIIDSDLWARVQQLSRAPSRTGHPASTHLFTGILRCARCGSSMQIETATGRSKTYSYYNCRAWLTAKACEPRRIRADRLDAFLIEAIGERVFTAGELAKFIRRMEEQRSEWHAHHARSVTALERELSRIRMKIQRLVDILADHGRDTPDLEGVIGTMTDLEQQSRKIERSIAVERSKTPPSDRPMPTTGELRRSLIKALQTTADPRRTRAFLQDFIQAIDVEDEQIRISYDPARIVQGPTPVVHSSVDWLPVRSKMRTASIVLEMPPEWRRRAA